MEIYWKISALHDIFPNGTNIPDQFIIIIAYSTKILRSDQKFSSNIVQNKQILQSNLVHRPKSKAAFKLHLFIFCGIQCK